MYVYYRALPYVSTHKKGESKRFLDILVNARIPRYITHMAKKARIGRPPKKVKEINPVRQVGRWTDEDWQTIKDAAAAEGLNVATWARPLMLKAARRVLKK